MTDINQEPAGTTPLSPDQRADVKQSWITTRDDLNKAERDNIVKGAAWARSRRGRDPIGRVQACAGDWIVYYEPRKVTATRGYFAMAKVAQVIADPGAPGMYLALIEPGSYLDFANPVPFADASGAVVERGVLNDQGKISGRAQSAVRPLAPGDFNRIVALGLSDSEPVLPRTGEALPPLDIRDGEQAPFVFEQSRDRASLTVSRIVRDRIFRRTVLRAYSERCAISGLRLINGGGRAEAAAAHIRPVEANGPDIVSNGIALSGTVHWMFDRGLIGLADDLRILISRQANDAESIRALVNSSGYALPPQRASERPHPHFFCNGIASIVSSSECALLKMRRHSKCI